MVRECFDRIEEPVASRGLPLPDCLLSARARFGLKEPALLRVEQAARGEGRPRSNLSRLYGVERAPSDTAMRERLDAVAPLPLRRAFKRVFAAWPRGGGLRDFAGLDDHDLLSVAGPGYFSSEQGQCAHGCARRHRAGRVSYSHPMLGAVLVPPAPREGCPRAPEPILRAAGSRQNACAGPAAPRLLREVRRVHPHLKRVVVEAAVAANGPHIRLLSAWDRRFGLGVKPGAPAEVFRWGAAGSATRVGETHGEDGGRRRDRWLKGGPRSDAHCDLEVHFLECGEPTPQGREQPFSGGTAMAVTASNVEALRRAGRAHWCIEHETFNTLQNQGATASSIPSATARGLGRRGVPS